MDSLTQVGLLIRYIPKREVILTHMHNKALQNVVRFNAEYLVTEREENWK